jgi:hypothetical protein
LRFFGITPGIQSVILTSLRAGILPRHERGTGRTADRVPSIPGGEENPALGQRVDIWRLIEATAVGRDVHRAEIVDQNDDNVWGRIRFRRNRIE